MIKKLASSSLRALKRATPALLVVSAIALGWTTSVLASHWRVVRAEQLRPIAEDRVFKILFMSDRGYMGGTGFLLQLSRNEKVVITNKHVCDAFERAIGPFIKGYRRPEAHPTRIIRASKVTDLCMIEAVPQVAEGVRGYELSRAPANPKDTVFTFGHPWLGNLTTNSGEYEGLATTVDDKGTFVESGRLSFPVFPGSSGSPVLNSRGNVVGVVFAYDGEGSGLFISLKELKDFIEESK